MGKPNYSDEGLSIREILLLFIKKTMDLSLMVVDESGRANKMRSYRESVLSLSDVLLPYYDSQMTEAYESYEKAIVVSKKRVADEQGNIINQHGWLTDNETIFRKLFRELNLLLNRNDYLKTTVFGEMKDEIVKDD